jgi:hypothetical protein
MVLDLHALDILGIGTADKTAFTESGEAVMPSSTLTDSKC